MNLSKQDLYNLLGNEKLRIELALIMANHDRPKAAKILNITERTLYRKLNDYDLKDEYEVKIIQYSKI